MGNSNEANPGPGGLAALLSGLKHTLGDLFHGGKLDAELEVMVEVLFGLAGYLARADSIVTTQEADFVNRLMDELDLPTRGRQLALDSFARGRLREIDLQHQTQLFLQTYGRAEVDRLYDALLGLAAADGRIRPREREFLQEITIRLGYDADVLDRRLQAMGS